MTFGEYSKYYTFRFYEIFFEVFDNKVAPILSILISLACSYFLLISFSICGTLHSVDQYLNIKLTDISVTDADKYPHMV